MVHHNCCIIKLTCFSHWFNNNSINTVSFSIYFPFHVIFIKKWQKKGIAIFSTGHPSWKVVEELQRAVAANPEEVAVGTDPNID